jgi:hypothetical protein
MGEGASRYDVLVECDPTCMLASSALSGEFNSAAILHAAQHSISSATALASSAARRSCWASITG